MRVIPLWAAVVGLLVFGVLLMLAPLPIPARLTIGAGVGFLVGRLFTI